jgi:1,4-dihydroxy-6-naphthoate synthase
MAHGAHPINLTLAHSDDADDVYMWWPVTGMIDPATREVISPPEVHDERVRLRARAEEIAVFNREALAGGGDDVAALSFAALARCTDRYAPTVFGASFGDGFGPSLASRPGWALHPRARIAVPGLTTTAAITLRLLHPGQFELIDVPIAEILPGVHEGRFEAGLIIHEAKLTIVRQGLQEVLDLGACWRHATGLPLPLGANAVRLDLDARHGAGTFDRVVALLRRSLVHASEHHERSAAYATTWAMHGGKLADPALARRYLAMYVNRYTLAQTPADAATVQRSIDVFWNRCARAGLLPPNGPVRVLGRAGYPDA